MQHQEFEAPAALHDTIKCFWYNKRTFETAESSFEVVPDGYAEIIFYFGNLYQAYPRNLQRLPSPFVMGLLNQPIIFYTDGPLEIIGIRCFPWTVFDLLGLPSRKQGVHLFEHPIADIQATLAKQVKTGQIDEAIFTLIQYCLAMRQQIAVDHTLAKAGMAIRKANGAMSVGKVAAEAHATVRTLERKFKQAAGHTVKDVSALIRFEQVRNRLWHHPDSNLAGLAHELGYTDQSHLSREFKRFTGTTPAAFAKKAKQGKQAISGDFVAFVQA